MFVQRSNVSLAAQPASRGAQLLQHVAVAHLSAQVETLRRAGQLNPGLVISVPTTPGGRFIAQAMSGRLP